MTKSTDQSLTDVLFGSAKDPIVNILTNILDIYQINKLKFACMILWNQVVK